MGHDFDHYQSQEHLENMPESLLKHIFQVFMWLVMVTVMTHHMRASLLRTLIMPIFKSLSKKSFDNSVYFTMTILTPTTLITILTWELENLNSWQSFWPDDWERHWTTFQWLSYWAPFDFRFVENTMTLRAILETCDLRLDSWDTDYFSDNWEQQY